MPLDVWRRLQTPVSWKSTLTGTIIQDTTPPPAPTGLVVTAGDAKAVLNWTVTAGMTYSVHQATTSGGTYTEVATNISGSTYTATGLTNGQAYYFKITAKNGTLTSAFSAVVGPRTPVAATTANPPKTGYTGPDAWMNGSWGVGLPDSQSTGLAAAGYDETDLIDMTVTAHNTYFASGQNDKTLTLRRVACDPRTQAGQPVIVGSRASLVCCVYEMAEIPLTGPTVTKTGVSTAAQGNIGAIPKWAGAPKSAALLWPPSRSIAAGETDYVRAINCEFRGNGRDGVLTPISTGTWAGSNEWETNKGAALPGCVAKGPFRATRCQFSGTCDIAKVYSNTYYEQNWLFNCAKVFDARKKSTSPTADPRTWYWHADLLQLLGATNWAIRDNAMEGITRDGQVCNSAIICKAEFESDEKNIVNGVISGNRLNGGQYSLGFYEDKILFNGTATAGSNIVTAPSGTFLTSTGGFALGDFTSTAAETAAGEGVTIIGTGIPAGTTIEAVLSSTQIRLSAAVTTSGTRAMDIRARFSGVTCGPNGYGDTPQYLAYFGYGGFDPHLSQAFFTDPIPGLTIAKVKDPVTNQWHATEQTYFLNSGGTRKIKRAQTGYLTMTHGGPVNPPVVTTT